LAFFTYQIGRVALVSTFMPHHKGDRENAFATRNEVSLAVSTSEQTIYRMDFHTIWFSVHVAANAHGAREGGLDQSDLPPASITFFRGTELFVMALRMELVTTSTDK
jgi:hypothetical protein